MRWREGDEERERKKGREDRSEYNCVLWGCSFDCLNKPWANAFVSSHGSLDSGTFHVTLSFMSKSNPGLCFRQRQKWLTVCDWNHVTDVTVEWTCQIQCFCLVASFSWVTLIAVLLLWCLSVCKYVVDMKTEKLEYFGGWIDVKLAKYEASQNAQLCNRNPLHPLPLTAHISATSKSHMPRLYM